MRVELEKLEKLGYGKKEAFNSLRTNLSFCGPDIQIITFTSCTPDEGKSSIVMELGRAVAEDGKKVLIIFAKIRPGWAPSGQKRSREHQGAFPLPERPGKACGRAV